MSGRNGSVTIGNARVHRTIFWPNFLKVGHTNDVTFHLETSSAVDPFLMVITFPMNKMKRDYQQDVDFHCDVILLFFYLIPMISLMFFLSSDEPLFLIPTIISMFIGVYYMRKLNRLECS